MAYRSAIFVALLGLFLAPQARAGMTEREKALITEALKVANLTQQDLEWDRSPFRDPFRMPIVDLALRDPISGTDHMLDLASSMGSASLTETLKLIEHDVFGGKWPPEPIGGAADAAPGLPASIAGPIAKLAAKINQANAEIRASVQGLTPEQERSLIESMAQQAVEAPEIKFDFVNEDSMILSEVLAGIGKINFPRIRATGAWLSREVSECVAALKAANSDVPQPIAIRLSGILVRVTGKQDDIHTKTDALLTIDLGGDDIYRGRTAAGVRYSSVSIDMAGDDRYESKDLSVGASALGIGIHYDLSGNDDYRCGNVTCGAALGGVGILVDGAGNDTYRAKTVAQGFGMFGVGLLLDLDGNDIYDIAAYGQGAGRTQGAGLLVDRKGRDSYRAGGLLLNSPLFADVYYSFAQGFGTGYREDTGGTSGGLGYLVDLSGDDAYIAETYAQAASYWFSVGGLYDGGGHDTYAGYHYCQSSAMHMCGAFLMDLGGDDQYGMKFGASHAIGHDYGTAVLLDRAGNDIYFARDSQPGIGNANGLAIFLDVIGDDRYQGPPGRGNGARGTGSFGLFVDGSGQDAYRDGLSDASASVNETWGVALDLATPKNNSIEGPTESTARPAPGSIPPPDTAEMERLYSKATQWAVGTAQKEVNETLGKLVGIGMPAVSWMLDQKLGKASRLEIRAFVEVIRDVGPEAREALAAKVLRGTLDEKRNGLGVAVDGTFKEVAPAVPSLISEPKLQLQAVRAAGTLKALAAVPQLMELASLKNLIGLASAVSLAQIGDESAYATAEALAPRAALPVRKAALQLMAQFPRRATETAKRFMLEDLESTVRLGIELLGMTGTEDALSEVGTRLLDPLPGVRMQALITLNGRCPSDSRLTFMSLRNDPDPMVRAVAQRVDPGR